MSGNTFSDLLYRFIAHYKWEPQHLLGSVKEFEDRARKQEVPLNFLLNAFLRFASSATIGSILTEGGLLDLELGSQTLQSKFPFETKFTQPDVLIESDKARVFIEVKIDSTVKLEQVQKYALLHAAMNTQEKKRPFDVLDEVSVSRMVEPLQGSDFFNRCSFIFEGAVRQNSGLGFFEAAS